MRRLTAVLWLQGMALLLAAAQSLVGVRTDEAKYLLNVPYPHPPLLRFVIGMTDALPLQDIVWRVIFATVLVQAVWLVYDLGRGLAADHRMALMAAWLCSSALLLQAGTVMLVVPTAIFTLVFLWLMICRERLNPGLIGILWLAAVFTALQSLLSAPLVWEALRRRGVHPVKRMSIVVLPVMLLLLSVAINPLALASIAGLGRDAVHADWPARIVSLGIIWVMGGGAVASVVGTFGMFRRPQWPLLLSFTALCAYILMSHGHAYYALLLLPLFIAGMHSVYASNVRPMPTTPVVAAMALLCTLFFARLQPVSPAAAVGELLTQQGNIRRVMISGPFGHEWQYALQADIRRFTPGLLPVTDAVICTADCPVMRSWDEEWETIDDAPEVWVRTQTP